MKNGFLKNELSPTWPKTNLKPIRRLNPSSPPLPYAIPNVKKYRKMQKKMSYFDKKFTFEYFLLLQKFLHNLPSRGGNHRKTPTFGKNAKYEVVRVVMTQTAIFTNIAMYQKLTKVRFS